MLRQRKEPRPPANQPPPGAAQSTPSQPRKGQAKVWDVSSTPFCRRLCIIIIYFFFIFFFIDLSLYSALFQQTARRPGASSAVKPSTPGARTPYRPDLPDLPVNVARSTESRIAQVEARLAALSSNAAAAAANSFGGGGVSSAHVASVAQPDDADSDSDDFDGPRLLDAGGKAPNLCL